MDNNPPGRSGEGNGQESHEVLLLVGARRRGPASETGAQVRNVCAVSLSRKCSTDVSRPRN